MTDNYYKQCNYEIGSLKPILYLADRKYLNIVNGVPKGVFKPFGKIHCETVNLTDESAFDNRYAFTYELTATIREDKNNLSLVEILKNTDFVLIIESKNGGFWSVDSEFPYKLTYDHEYSTSNEQCTLVFALSQNVPVLVNIDTTDVKSLNDINGEFCEYFKPNEETFEIIEKDYLTVSTSETHYTNILRAKNADWKTVQPLKNSLSFKHSFDGEKYTEEVSFSISMNQYKQNFTYNLIEFLKNKYVVRFRSSKGNYYLMGFENGLFPSFSVQSGEGSSLNTINITLKGIGNNGTKIKDDNATETVTDKDVIISPTTSDNKNPSSTVDFEGKFFDTMECVSPTMAKRMIVMVEDEDKCYCHVDYKYKTELSKYITVVGTYTDSTYGSIANVNDLPLFVFTDACMSIYDGGGSPTPPDTGITADTAIVRWFDTNEYECVEDTDPNSTPDSIYKWEESSETACDGIDKYSVVYLMRSDNHGINWKKTTIWRYGELLEPNTTDCGGNVPSTGTTPSYTGQTEEIFKWEDSEDYICNEGNLYYLSYQYSSRDKGNTWKKTGETRLGQLIETDSPTCSEVPDIIYRWIEVEDATECLDGSLYQILKRQKSEDGGKTWTDEGSTKRGNLIERYSDKCGYVRWSEVPNQTMCDGTNLYSVMKREFSYDNLYWIETGDIKRGNLIEEDSSECTSQVNTRLVYIGDFCGSELDDYNIVNRINKLIVYGSTTTTNDYCNGYDWMRDTTTHYLSGYSENELVEYSASTSTSVLEYNSTNHCGYKPQPTECNTKVYYKNGTTQNYQIVGTLNNSYFFVNTLITKVEISDCVTRIGDFAFMGCTSLTSATIPNSVLYIDLGAFESATTLTSVIIPDSVTSIGNQAFSLCKSLTSATIGNSVINLGEYSFASCPNLKTVSIGNSVETIGALAFYSATTLTSITIPDSVTSIGKQAFEQCTSLSSITFGNGLTSIGDSAFYRCTKLKSLLLPNNLKTIGEYAFNNCTGLTSITIPNSVTTIGQAAFVHCDSLSSLTIGSGVTSIGSNAFNYCPTQGELYCSEEWYNNLSSTNKSNLKNIVNWTKHFI